MEKIPRFTREVIQTLREDINRALVPVKEKYGLDILTVESVLYRDETFTAKVSGDVSGDPEGVLQEIDARFFAMRHGLPEDILSREFSINGDVFQVMRIEPRNFKYPVIARCKRDGKTYKFSVEQVKNYELRKAKSE